MNYLLQVYFYNGSVAKPRPEQNQEKKKKSEEPNYFAGIKPIDNKLEVRADIWFL